MMSFPDMSWLLFVVPAAVQTLLVLRMISSGLAGIYPAFTSWMVLLITNNLVLMAVARWQPGMYRNAWIVSQVIGLLALFAALVELSSRILSHYPGLRRVSTSSLFGILVAAALVTSAAQSMGKPVRFFLMLNTGWNAAAAVYTILLVGLATYLDPRRRPNVLIHERTFLTYCALSATLLLANTTPILKDKAGLVSVLAGVVFPMMWMRMNAAGEIDHRPEAKERAGELSVAEMEATIDRLERMVTRSGA